jgi:hypothetical protein
VERVTALCSSRPDDSLHPEKWVKPPRYILPFQTTPWPTGPVAAVWGPEQLKGTVGMTSGRRYSAVMHTSRVSSPRYSASRVFFCLETASLYLSPTRLTRLLPQLIFHCATVFYAPRRHSRLLARRPHSPTTLDSARARLAASCASLVQRWNSVIASATISSDHRKSEMLDRILAKRGSVLSLASYASEMCFRRYHWRACISHWHLACVPGNHGSKDQKTCVMRSAV